MQEREAFCPPPARIYVLTNYERVSEMAYDDRYAVQEAQRHLITLEGRRRMSVSGVSDVESFDEAEIIMQTSQGTLIVRGAELHIGKLSLDTGDVTLEGVVDKLEYENDTTGSGGLFSRLFK